ncbi:enhanced serine sensitivity protein SseB C-terminal domain-containing protein [Bradyrhizobium sp.]|uniref:enhanced serine sensitivity protein SseB C-terminal domain-containing protein n=1 Tax=Bradyrhizobium sp. TaxID=376 RepID=UPI0039E42070
MFEPENEIERMLMRAAQEPSERPAFARALLDAETVVVLVPEAGRIAPGPDGHAIIPEGTRLSMPSVTRGGERFLPFFTAPSRARAWFGGDHVVAPDSTRDLFGRYPEASFVLNPGSDYGKEFTPAEVKRLLAGHFEEGAETITIPAGEQLLLGHPSDVPEALISALSREFGTVKSIRGAWLMLAARAGHAEQSWMLGVDHEGSWSKVQAAINRAVAGDVLKGRPLDAVPLEDSSLASTLRTGIPIPAAKRGLFQKLFR